MTTTIYEGIYSAIDKMKSRLGRNPDYIIVPEIMCSDKYGRQLLMEFASGVEKRLTGYYMIDSFLGIPFVYSSYPQLKAQYESNKGKNVIWLWKGADMYFVELKYADEMAANLISCNIGCMEGFFHPGLCDHISMSESGGISYEKTNNDPSVFTRFPSKVGICNMELSFSC